jgi:hypothetical protein
MENTKHTSGSVRSVLLYLLAPEDSSAMPARRRLQRASVGWNRTKTGLWLVVSLMAALLVGQL